jgi:phosphoribosylanthranilate isomerase
MARVRVKICGITNTDDARAAVEAGADAIGLVFADSPRQVDVPQARLIAESLPPWVGIVGVFVNSAIEQVLSVAAEVRLDVVQLHGDEKPADVKAIMQRTKVIRAFRLADEDDARAAMDYLKHCRPDACLIDAKVSGAYGGTGHVAPWNLAAGLREQAWPLILGGGLNASNVEAAIEAVRPYGVEASSGVEREPGRKDPEAMRAFIEAATGKQVNYPVVNPED